MFATLRSQQFTDQDDEGITSPIPKCSPKSMYRLAMKVCMSPILIIAPCSLTDTYLSLQYGNQELRVQAGTDIRSKLSTQNVLDELFSTFTSR